MKRLYSLVAVLDAPGGFGVALDGRPVRTPRGEVLALPDAALAEAIAEEWRAQGDTVVPHTMPLMRLVCTAVDRVAETRPAVIDHLLAFAGTDMLCYRSAEAAGLAREQERLWQPLLDWAASVLAVPLETTTGLLPVPQPAPALAALRRHVESYDDWRLTALADAVAALGSLVLGLALAEGRIDADEAIAAADLEEDWQNRRWGVDPLAAERRRAVAGEIRAAAGLLALRRLAAR